MKNKKKLSLPVMIWIISLILIALLVNISITEHKPFLYVLKTHLRTSVILIFSNLLVIILHVIKRSKARYYIEKIENLDWSKANPYAIVYASLVSAIEFAESLNKALMLYKSNPSLNEMAKGELQTDNLQFDDYHQRGDHYEFLSHFVLENQLIVDLMERLEKTKNKYMAICNSLTDDQCFQTIVSRERTLPGIFQKILDSHDWEALGLGFYAYYLREHIRLDSQEGGHADLLKDVELNEKVLRRFWKARYEMYQSLFSQQNNHDIIQQITLDSIRKIAVERFVIQQCFKKTGNYIITCGILSGLICFICFITYLWPHVKQDAVIKIISIIFSLIVAIVIGAMVGLVITLSLRLFYYSYYSKKLIPEETILQLMRQYIEGQISYSEQQGERLEQQKERLEQEKIELEKDSTSQQETLALYQSRLKELDMQQSDWV